MTPEMVPLKPFDLLIVPAHDVLRHSALKRLKNVIFTLGAPNRINKHVLEQEKNKLSCRLKIPENSVKTGIVIGGNDQNYFIDIEWIRIFFEQIKKLPGDKFSFFLTTSRRTPKEIVDFLRKETDYNQFIYTEFPDEKPGIHYFGILGICDILLVTEDSINMVSEACSTGKPVAVVQVKKKKESVADLTISELVKNGYCLYIPLKDFVKLDRIIGEIYRKKPAKVLSESEKCAKKIKEIIQAGF